MRSFSISSISAVALIALFDSLAMTLSFAPSKNVRIIHIKSLRSPFERSTTRSLQTNKSNWSMHMGHSHAHHDHSHVHQSDKKVTLRQKVTPRRAAIFIFVALAILGPPLVRRRALQRADVATFFLTSTVLAVGDKIRDQVQSAIRTIGNFRNGIVKHSSPVSPGKTLKYLFKNDNAADRVTLLGGVMNLALSLGKFAVGVTCHSSALIADAGHSLSDLFSDFITLWAVQIGRLPPDDDHPYGHAKFEAIGSLFLALTLLGTGLSVGAVSNKKLIEILSTQRTGTMLPVQIPTAPALAMAGLSIFSKEWLFRITRQVGEKLNSQVVIANAWHHRSDAYSSVLALFAIGLAMFFPGLIAVDAAAGILVAGMICMTGAEILGESIKQLTDTSNDALVQQVNNVANKYSSGEFQVGRIRARQVGSSAMVDVNIETSGDLSSSESHRIAEGLKHKIMRDVDVLDAEVHASAARDDSPLLTPETRSTQVESQVRDEIQTHPAVNSVVGVTVRHADSSSMNHVDVVISVDPDATVAAANLVAADLRDSLEMLDNVDKASIFLDLNLKAQVPQSQS